MAFFMQTKLTAINNSSLQDYLRSRINNETSEIDFRCCLHSKNDILILEILKINEKGKRENAKTFFCGNHLF